MTQEVEIKDQHHSHISAVKHTGNSGATRCRQIIAEQFLPRTKQCIKLGATTCRKRLLPGIKTGSSLIGHEIKKIHGKQNWFKRCGITMIDNAAGLGMAMLAGKIVQSHVEVQQFSNLWGLLATRPVVSESTYEILNFAAEFFIALLVFTLTEHYLDEYRKRRKTAGTAAEQTRPQ